MVFITKQESKAIDGLRLISVFSVVMIHCALNNGYMQEMMSPETLKEVSQWHAFLFCSYCLPFLFFLSGYLFFRNTGEEYDVKRDYLFKLKSRISSLLLLWFVYGVLAVIFDHFVKHDPLPSGYTILHSLIPYKDLSDGNVIAKGMWFIRSLVYFSILSPIYYFVLRYAKHFALVIALILYRFDIPITFAFFNCYLLFGAYLAYHGFSFSKLTELLDWRFCFIGGAVLAVFNFNVGLPGYNLVSAVLVFNGFFGLFLKCPLPKFMTAASTFIYAAHFFLVGGFRQFFFNHLPHSLPYYVLCMVVTWAVTILALYIAYFFVSRVKVLRYLLTGGR